MLLYRDMEEGRDGKPVTGFVSRHLGVRIAGITVGREDAADVEADTNGDAHPDQGGVSVIPPCVNKNVKKMSIRRITRKQTVMWAIDESDLSQFGLKYREDPTDSSHGFIEPANKMAAREFVSRVAQTRDFWSKTDDLQL